MLSGSPKPASPPQSVAPPSAVPIGLSIAESKDEPQPLSDALAGQVRNEIQIAFDAELESVKQFKLSKQYRLYLKLNDQIVVEEEYKQVDEEFYGKIQQKVLAKFTSENAQQINWFLASALGWKTLAVQIHSPLPNEFIEGIKVFAIKAMLKQHWNSILQDEKKNSPPRRIIALEYLTKVEMNEIAAKLYQEATANLHLTRGVHPSEIENIKNKDEIIELLRLYIKLRSSNQDVITEIRALQRPDMKLDQLDQARLNNLKKLNRLLFIRKNKLLDLEREVALVELHDRNLGARNIDDSCHSFFLWSQFVKDENKLSDIRAAIAPYTLQQPRFLDGFVSGRKQFYQQLNQGRVQQARFQFSGKSVAELEKEYEPISERLLNFKSTIKDKTSALSMMFFNKSKQTSWFDFIINFFVDYHLKWWFTWRNHRSAAKDVVASLRDIKNCKNDKDRYSAAIIYLKDILNSKCVDGKLNQDGDFMKHVVRSIHILETLVQGKQPSIVVEPFRIPKTML